jgi:hypothetical protein
MRGDVTNEVEIVGTCTRAGAGAQRSAARITSTPVTMTTFRQGQ